MASATTSACIKHDIDDVEISGRIYNGLAYFMFSLHSTNGNVALFAYPVDGQASFDFICMSTSEPFYAVALCAIVILPTLFDDARATI